MIQRTGYRVQVTGYRLQGTVKSFQCCTALTLQYIKPVLTGMNIGVPVDRPEVKKGHGYTNTIL